MLGHVFDVHAGGHFVARALAWAHGRAFRHQGVCLGTREGILALGRTLGHAGGHFGIWARVWAHGRAF